MKVSRIAKEVIADLVFTMKMGQVFIGPLRDATHLENLYPGYQGMLSVEDLLRPHIGSQIVLIVLSLSDPEAPPRPQSRETQ